MEGTRGVQSAHARPDKAILSDPSCLHQQRALAMARRQDLIGSPLPRWRRVCKGSWRKTLRVMKAIGARTMKWERFAPKKATLAGRGSARLAKGLVSGGPHVTSWFGTC